jgi:hypothetical protein
MSNTILSVTELANRAVDTLVQMRPLVETLDNDMVAAEMAMNKGETVNVAIPPTFTAATYNGSSLTIQDINNGSVAVVLDQDVVVPIAIPNREFAKSAQDLNRTVITPIMEAFVVQMDAGILTKFDAGDTLTPIAESTNFTIAQMELGIAALAGVNCPLTDLHFAISQKDASEARQIQAIYSQDVNSLNNNRLATVGSYAGIDIFGTTAIASTGTDVENWLYDSKFATVAMRALDVQSVSGVEVGVASYKGMTITVTRSWDYDTQAVQTVFRALYGVKVLDGNRGIKVIIDGSGD